MPEVYIDYEHPVRHANQSDGFIEFPVKRTLAAGGTLYLALKAKHGLEEFEEDVKFEAGSLTSFVKFPIKQTEWHDDISEIDWSFGFKSGPRTKMPITFPKVSLKHDVVQGCIGFVSNTFNCHQSQKSINIPVVRDSILDIFKNGKPAELTWKVIKGRSATKVDDGKVTLSKGQQDVDIILEFTKEVLDDDDTEIVIELTNPKNCHITQGKHLATINVTNDFTGGLFGFRDPSPITLVQSEQKVAKFTIDRDVCLKGKVKITVDIDSEHDPYHTQKLDIETFKSGENDSTVEVDIPQKFFKEDHHLFKLSLKKPTNGGEINPDRDTLTVKVVNDLGPASITLDKQNIEVLQSAGQIIIPVLRTGKLATKCDAKYKLVGDTDVVKDAEGFLENELRGTVKFGSNDTHERIIIDLEKDPMETDMSVFKVVLFDPDNCNIIQEECKISIDNDITNGLFGFKTKDEIVLYQSEQDKGKTKIQRYQGMVGKVKVGYQFIGDANSPYASVLENDVENFKNKEEFSTVEFPVLQKEFDEDEHVFYIQLLRPSNGADLDPEREKLKVRIINDLGRGQVGIDLDRINLETSNTLTYKQSEKNIIVPMKRWTKLANKCDFKYKVTMLTQHDGDVITDNLTGKVNLDKREDHDNVVLPLTDKFIKGEVAKIKVELYDADDCKFRSAHEVVELMINLDLGKC